MKTIKIEAKRFTGTSKKTGNAYDFIAHKIVGNDGKKYDVMFTKRGNANSLGIGKMEGTFTILVDKDNMWKARGERKYPLYFIDEIEDIVLDESVVTYPYGVPNEDGTPVAVEVEEHEDESDLPF